MEHDWIKSTLGHGETMCSRCKITNREAAVLGELNNCSAAPAADATEPDSPPPDEYAVLEVFGRRKHAGRIKEVDLFGTKLCRIDIPKDGDFAKGFNTHFYGGASIFSMTPCDLAYVQRANKPYEPASRLTYREEEDDHAESFEDVEEGTF